MISIDNTSGCQLYLSKESLEASITTAKSSEINALIPNANGDGDWVSNFLIFTFGLCVLQENHGLNQLKLFEMVRV
jgi:hypothetical protein